MNFNSGYKSVRVIPVIIRLFCFTFLTTEIWSSPITITEPGRFGFSTGLSYLNIPLDLKTNPKVKRYVRQWTDTPSENIYNFEGDYLNEIRDESSIISSPLQIKRNFMDISLKQTVPGVQIFYTIPVDSGRNTNNIELNLGLYLTNAELFYTEKTVQTSTVTSTSQTNNISSGKDARGYGMSLGASSDRYYIYKDFFVNLSGNLFYENASKNEKPSLIGPFDTLSIPGTIDNGVTTEKTDTDFNYKKNSLIYSFSVKMAEQVKRFAYYIGGNYINFVSNIDEEYSISKTSTDNTTGNLQVSEEYKTNIKSSFKNEKKIYLLIGTEYRLNKTDLNIEFQTEGKNISFTILSKTNF